MDIWEKLSNLKIENPERFKEPFNEIISEIRKDSFALRVYQKKEKGYYVIVETNRLRSYFVHIVPEESYNLFKEISQKAPQQFLGFSVFVKKYHDKDVRVSCFGIPCSLLVSFLSDKKTT